MFHEPFQALAFLMEVVVGGVGEGRVVATYREVDSDGKEVEVEEVEERPMEVRVKVVGRVAGMPVPQIQF
jgi:hypothetical protein